jgi:hypothetical protein
MEALFQLNHHAVTRLYSGPAISVATRRHDFQVPGQLNRYQGDNFGGDQDLMAVFLNNSLSDLKKLKHYYHVPAMGKCFANLFFLINCPDPGLNSLIGIRCVRF